MKKKESVKNKMEQEDYRDKYTLEDLIKEEAQKSDPSIVEDDSEKESDEDKYLALDRPHQEFPYAVGFRRHKVPSNHFDKISRYQQQFINFNRKNINKADKFHDKMDDLKASFIEEMAEMFQTEERAQFEHRNSFAYDGYTYPPKWVVSYYLEHEDDLFKPFLHQMQKEMGTSLFANFNSVSYHGWNKIVFKPYTYWQLEGENEVPIAIYYFRKAGIKFKIWPTAKHQTLEPESTITVDEWVKWLKNHQKINWIEALNKAEVLVNEFMKLRDEEEKMLTEERRLQAIKRYAEIEKIKAQRQKTRQRKSGWMNQLDANIERNKKIEEERLKEKARKIKERTKKRKQATEEFRDLVHMIARADTEIARVDKKIREIKINIKRIEIERAKHERTHKFKLKKLEEVIPMPGDVRMKSLHFFEIPQFSELVPFAIVGILAVLATKLAFHDLWNVSDPAIKKIWDRFGHGLYKHALVDDNNFFDKLFDRKMYLRNLLTGNVTTSREVRVVALDFPNLYPIGLNRFMRLWKSAALNEDIYRPKLITILPLSLRKKIPNGFTLADIPMKTFLLSPMVKLALDFVVPDADILFYGVKINRTKKYLSIKELGLFNDCSVEKFALTDMSVKDAWEYFAADDKILVIQDPITDDDPKYYQLKQSLPFVSHYFRQNNHYVTNFPTIINNFDYKKPDYLRAVKKLRAEMKKHIHGKHMSMQEFFTSDKVKKIFGIKSDKKIEISIRSKSNLKEIFHFSTHDKHLKKKSRNLRIL